MNQKEILQLGKRFGRLTLVKYLYKKNGHKYFLCKCDCGNEKVIRGDSLKYGNTKSCGCIAIENTIKRSKKHGDKNTRFYRIFTGLKQRCNNKNGRDYKNYGERGIKCEWNSYEDFKQDMYSLYLEHCKECGEKQTTIDRIDNDGNYSKENCKWSTYKEQNNNRRDNIIINFNGKDLTLKQYSEEIGINYPCIFNRFKKGIL